MNELCINEPKLLVIKGRRLCLVLTEKGIFCVEDACPHQGESLSRGKVRGCEIVCAAHNWRFDLQTGDSPVVPDAFVNTFECKIENANVYVKM